MRIRSTIDALAHRARIWKFASVGAIGATIETLTVALLTAGAGVPPLAAKAVGSELSISTMFVINDRWTFTATTGIPAILHRWFTSHIVRAFGLLIGFTVLYLLTAGGITLLIAGIDVWPPVANLIGIGFGMGFNYVAESLITWDVSERTGRS